MLSTPEILFQNDINVFVKPKGRNVNTGTIKAENLPHGELG
jgi:hypothetical protein